MLASDQAVSEFTLPPVDVRSLARRAVVPAVVAAVAVGVLVLGGGPIHAITDALRRGLDASPAWAVLGIAFECASLAGYVALMSLVAGRATSRIGMRESAQITLTGAAATRLLPTAGAGGIALAVWALRRAGLRPASAARTLLSFLVLLYSVFLSVVVLAGAALAFGLVAGHGPAVLGAIPAAAATIVIGLCLVLATRKPSNGPGAATSHESDHHRRRSQRVRSAAQMTGGAVRDAIALVSAGDLRIAGAAAYWVFDAAVLWSMLHAFGSPPTLPVVALAYFIGQVANTLPIPGSVSGGMAGVLIAFGVHPELALPAVLAYRTLAVWLPLPAALVSIPRLRATVARWGRDDTAAAAPAAVKLAG
ncbi:MAG TPA: lysylphosphatidylglycerol synthase transmembrane domain-containing protein [Solirubrobacteraceae bacterium]